MKLRRWLATLLLLAASHAMALGPAVQRDLPAARLAGEGSFRWFGIKIYDARLWVGEQGYQADKAPHALELVYARTLYGKKIAEASIDEIKKLGLGSEPQHTEWLATMTKLFPDVQDGSRITGVYLPPGVTRFYLGDKLLGDVADAAFARAFFGIWLDPKTSAPALRTALLRAASARP